MDCLYELQAAQNYKFFTELPNSFKKIKYAESFAPKKLKLA